MPNRLIHIIAFLLISFSGYAQVIEKNYVTTDKTIYAPEDTVWFKAYVFDRANAISDQSVALHLVVADAEGNKKLTSSWPIIEGVSDGYFVAPLLEGSYLISTVSGQMMVSDTSLIFRKSFYVRSDLADEYILSAYPQFDALQEKQPNAINIFTRNTLDKAAPERRLRYSLFDQNKEIDNGRLRTDENGKVILTIDPKKIKEANSDLLLVLESNDRGSAKPIKLTVPIKVDRKSIDLQILPEGGKLIAGVANKVAFKTIDEQGQPFDFKALLIDEAGQVLDTVSSIYAGMGSFNLIPTTNQLLRLEVVEPAVRNPIFEIGEVQASGVALSIVGEGDDRLIRLLPNQKGSEETFTIEISQFDQVIQSTDSKVEHRQFFKIPWENLAPGLVRVTLIQQGTPYSERVFFNDPSAQLNIDIQTDKETYTTREKVNLDITVTNDEGKPVIGSFSLAAIDAVRALSPAQGQANILASLLLTLEIKGEVPTPNFYFSNHELAVPALDLVTLTNGYRKYVSSNYNDPEAIVGYLYGNANEKKRLKNKDVALISNTGQVIDQSKSDENGGFKVPASSLKYYGDSLIITALNKGKKDRFTLMLDDSIRTNKEVFEQLINQVRTPSINTESALYLSQYKLSQDRFQNTILLNSVEVNARAERVNDGCSPEDILSGEPWTTKTIDQLDLTNPRIMNLIKQVSDKVAGYQEDNTIRFNRLGVKGKLTTATDIIMSTLKTIKYKIYFSVYLNCDYLEPEYMGDNQPFNHNHKRILESIDFSNLEAISIYIEPGQSERPIIQLKTINNEIIYKNTFQRSYYIRPFTNYTTTFYAPKYDTPEKQNDPVPDLRTTIFWSANLVTDENGKATVSYYNADRANPIQITVEGVGQQSHVGTATKTYKVEERK